MASILCYMTLLLCAVALSEGCSCAEPVPPSDWKGNAYEYWNKQRLCAADYAIKGKVLERSDDPLSVGSVIYKIKVTQSFVGSFDEKEIVELKTKADEAQCGVHLNLEGTQNIYLLTGGNSNGQLEIELCGWYEPWKDDTREKIRKALKKC